MAIKVGTNTVISDTRGITGTSLQVGATGAEVTYPSTRGTTGHLLSQAADGSLTFVAPPSADGTGGSGTMGYWSRTGTTVSPVNANDTVSALSGSFSSTLSGATATFSGTVSGDNGNFSGTVSAASGSFSGTVSASVFDIDSLQPLS